MHDAVVALNLADRESADIVGQVAIGGNGVFPGAALKQSEVATGDRVTGVLEQRHQMGADITFVTGDQYFHDSSKTPLCPVQFVRPWLHSTDHGALPDFHSSSRYSRSRWVSMAAQKPRCLRILSCRSPASLTSGSRSRTQLSSLLRYFKASRAKKKYP